MSEMQYKAADTTFRAYTSAQAQEYARQRGGYPQRLVDEIVAVHRKNDETFDTLLDLGCGPGTATRELAAYFNHATGIDPSTEMIAAATGLGGSAKKSTIRYLCDEAEACRDIPDNSIDLITAATSAHWFDMRRFWPTAARILKPGGTVAFFTIWRVYFHPLLTPRAEELQALRFELEYETLAPYNKKGNWSVMRLYEDLVMPWDLPPDIGLESFKKQNYSRQVWNEDGKPEADGTYVSGERVRSLEDSEASMGTTSPVTRWRQAHPDLAGTQKDCVKMAFASMREILETDGGWSGEVTMVGPSVLNTVKKNNPRQTTFLDVVRASDDFPIDPSAAEQYYSLFLPNDSSPHGYLTPATVAAMPWTSSFSVHHDHPCSVTVLTASAEATNAAFAELIDACITRNLFHVLDGQHSEPFAILGADPPVRIERFATSLFGVTACGAHLLAYVEGGTEMQIWIARRASHLYSYPGTLDTTVGGGVTAGSSPFETVVREAQEEASLPSSLIREQAKARGVITNMSLTGADWKGEKGLVLPDVLYVYDVELPAEIEPTPGDEEVESFALMGVDEIKDRLLRWEFKPDSAAVLIEFMIRKAFITPENEKDYVEVAAHLHRRLPFRITPPRR